MSKQICWYLICRAFKVCRRETSDNLSVTRNIYIHTYILFAPASAPQGIQVAHGLHLLVPGAGVVGGRSTNKKFFIWESQQNMCWYLICPCKCSPRPPGGTWPTPFGPWCWCCGTNPQVTHQWIRPIKWLIRWAIKLQDWFSSFREHLSGVKIGILVYIYSDDSQTPKCRCDAITTELLNRF